MSHAAAGVARMKHPAQSFREIVADVHDSWAMVHNDITCVLPFLDGKVLNVDVTRARGGTRFVNHCNRSLIVNEQLGSTGSQGFQFLQNVAKAFDCLRADNCGTELSLSGTGCYWGLDATLASDGSTAKEDDMRRPCDRHPDTSRICCLPQPSES